MTTNGAATCDGYEPAGGLSKLEKRQGDGTAISTFEPPAVPVTPLTCKRRAGMDLWMGMPTGPIRGRPSDRPRGRSRLGREESV